MFTNEPSSDVTPSIPYVETISFCDKILFSHNAVYNKLSNLLLFKSPGPDNLHPFVFKSLCDIVCKPLAIIFQTSLDKMSLPNIWKTANVSSIFKKRDRSDPSNYHPISLTCVACKIMESIIKDVVMTYLLENNLLSNCQFGFVSGRSVQLQLQLILTIGLTFWTVVTQLMLFTWISRKHLIQFPTCAFYPNYIPMGFVMHFYPGLSHSLLDDDKGFVSMILYLCGIMSPVAYLKEVFSDLSSFYCISMTYPTMSHQIYICLQTTQKYTAL